MVNKKEMYIRMALNVLMMVGKAFIHYIVFVARMLTWGLVYIASCI